MEKYSNHIKCLIDVQEYKTYSQDNGKWVNMQDLIKNFSLHLWN